MQGSIFTSFSEMVIKKRGMTVWNELLEKVPACSQGNYTNGMQYGDSEIMASLGELTAGIAHKINTPFGYFNNNNLSCLAYYLTNFFSLDRIIQNSNTPLENASAVLKHNGKIKVQSVENEGTCFIIELPIEK